MPAKIAPSALLQQLKEWPASTRLYGAVVLVVIVLDQVSKYWAVAALTRAFGRPSDAAMRSFSEKLRIFLWQEHPMRAQPITVLENFWHFRYAENPGAAFSFLAAGPSWFRTPFFLTVSLIAMVFILAYFRKTTHEQTGLRWALALVFGGALGNFIDRVRLGYVIDFIDWHWFDKATWPTFNIADSAITVGVALMVLDMLRNPKPVASPAPASKQ